MEAYLQNILELCWDTFPWICNQAISVGRRRRNNRLCKLGGELFILTQEILFITETKTYPNLAKIVELVSKACFNGKEEWFDAMRQIADIQQMSSTRDAKTFATDIHDSLIRFVSEDPTYTFLLQLIGDSVRGTDFQDTLPEENSHPRAVDDLEYPTHVNNTLYSQLETNSVCTCSSDHLKWARLRLDPDINKDGAKDVSFQFLFAASSMVKHQSISLAATRWKDARISVARHRHLKRKRTVDFAVQHPGHVHKLSNNEMRLKVLKAIGPGDFCRLIKKQPNSCVHLYVQNNTMSISEPAQSTRPRNMMPSDGTSLAQWLQQAQNIPKRVKIILAYTVARSVWQYYNSYWMTTPWTHDNIQFLQERNQATETVQPHIFFVTRLIAQRREVLDYQNGEDLVHIYPNILALGVVLIEIALGDPFKPGAEDSVYLWDETTFNDYYDWAYTMTKGGELRQAVGAIYEDVVSSCLDDEAFRDGPVDLSNHSESSDLRRLRLFERVVAPLQELYQAYRDDWGLQDVPPAATSSLISDHTRHGPDSFVRPADRNQFTVAVFCALSIEADAVVELFDSIWAERTYGKAARDSNSYTLGRMGRHNVVLVHMAGIGKGAACQAASCTRSSYPEIRIALVVGICGGVPSNDKPAEIILGDVVVSSSIVQYDLGRQYPHTFRARSSHEVCSPLPTEFQSLLSKLKSSRGQQVLLARLLENLTRLREQLGPQRTTYPGTDQDELFPAHYHHKHQHIHQCEGCRTTDNAPDGVCEEARLLPCRALGCEKSLIIKRKRLQAASKSNRSPTPTVHIGSVGSGDTVMKSGIHRDATAKHHDLIAFEMEASGICDIFPAITIKGVCDYADSHKNKAWQGYATTTAAACMKAFLDEWAG